VTLSRKTLQGHFTKLITSRTSVCQPLVVVGLTGIIIFIIHNYATGSTATKFLQSNRDCYCRSFMSAAIRLNLFTFIGWWKMQPFSDDNNDIFSTSNTI